MQFHVLIGAALLAVTLVQAYPGLIRPEDDPEVVVVPLEAQEGLSPYDIPVGEFGQPIVDTGLPSNFFSFSPFIGNPFSGLFGGLEASIARMRQQIAEVLARLPPTEESFASLGKGNTTSTVKIIDGHKVVINETTYENAEDGSILKIKVVDFRESGESSEDVDNTIAGKEAIPTETTKNEVEDLNDKVGDDQEEAEEPKASTETVEDSKTEVKKSDKNENDGLETFDDSEESHQDTIDVVPAQPKKIAQIANDEWDLVDSEFDDFVDTNDVETNDIDDGGHFEPVDLSNDIAVNQMMADSGVTPDPDAELFDIIDTQTNTKFFYPAMPRSQAMRIK